MQRGCFFFPCLETDEQVAEFGFTRSVDCLATRRPFDFQGSRGGVPEPCKRYLRRAGSVVEFVIRVLYSVFSVCHHSRTTTTISLKGFSCSYTVFLYYTLPVYLYVVAVSAMH